MSTLKVSTISPLGTDATKTITIGSASNGDVAAGVFTNVPAFMVVKGSDQTISTATWTKVTSWATPLWDTDSGWSSSDSKWTVPTGKGGKYIFHAHVYFTSFDDGKKLEARLYKNGSNAGGSTTGSASVRVMSGGTNQEVDIGWSWIGDLSAGDYIEYYVNQNNGDNQTLYRESWFSAQRLIGV